MEQILMIEVSPRGKGSASRSVADTLAARLTDLYPSAKLMRRDQGNGPAAQRPRHAIHPAVGSLHAN